jgi:arylsulfatase A-like enzyme
LLLLLLMLLPLHFRTGTVYNTLGYDSFSLGEATAGDVMQQAGYVTSHFGKW